MIRLNSSAICIILAVLMTGWLNISVLAADKTKSPVTDRQNQSGWVENVIVIKFKESLPSGHSIAKTGLAQIDQLLARNQIYDLQPALSPAAPRRA